LTADDTDFTDNKMLSEKVTFTFAARRRESRFVVIGFLRVVIHADGRSAGLALAKISEDLAVQRLT